MAVEALDIHLRRGFGKREVVGTEAHHGILTVKAFDEYLKGAFKVSHGNALVHHKSLYLVEQRRVGGVHCVGAVNAPRCDNSYRGLLLFHNAHLNRRGLGAKQHVFGDIEGILSISCGVILREVQRLEVIIVGFHLGTLGNGKAHADENILNLVKNKVKRVLLTGGAGRARKRYVNCFGSKLLFKHMLPDMSVRLFKFIFDFGANLVRHLTDNRAFLRGKPAHLLEYGSQLALFTKVANAKLLKPFGILRRGKLLLCLLANLLQQFFHCIQLRFL